MSARRIALQSTKPAGEQSPAVLRSNRTHPVADPKLHEAVEFFAGHPNALAAFRKIFSLLAQFGGVTVRVSKSQVAFRRRRGFAYVWMPGMYLAKPTAEVVLSIALGRRDGSPRFKSVVQPAPNRWMHHLEIHDVDDVDDQVISWLREAADRAR